MKAWERIVLPEDPVNCVHCGRTTSGHDDAVFTVVMPRGITREQMREACRQVDDAPAPTSEEERSARLVFFGVSGGAREEATAKRQGLSQETQIADGRALIRLGARLVAMHSECSEQVRSYRL